MAVLDTSFLVDLERGLPAAHETLRRLRSERQPLLVPAQVALEFVAGVAKQADAFHRIVGSWTVVPVGWEHILEGAFLARRAFAVGRHQGWPDVHIAAVARLRMDCVVTANARHFAALGVPVRDHRVAA